MGAILFFVFFQTLYHFVGYCDPRMSPGINHLVIPFTLRQHSIVIVLLNFSDLFFGLMNNLLFFQGNFKVSYAKGQSRQEWLS